MKITASGPAVEWIRDRGGRLFVWAGAHCCGGTRFVESSTEAPGDLQVFHREQGPGFELFVRQAGGQIPEEIVVELRGRRRPRLAAYWNGCPYVV